MKNFNFYYLFSFLLTSPSMLSITEKARWNYFEMNFQIIPLYFFMKQCLIFDASVEIHLLFHY